MHEFSLATNIIEIVRESAREANAKEISEIHLEIGTISGVETEALLTALESITAGTYLEKTEINIDHIKARARCQNCKHEFDITDIFELCPKCQSFQNEILKGKEFRIKSIVAIES